MVLNVSNVSDYLSSISNVQLPYVQTYIYLENNITHITAAFLAVKRDNRNNLEHKGKGLS